MKQVVVNRPGTWVGPEPIPMSPPFMLPTRGLPPRLGMVGIRAGRSETGLMDVFFWIRLSRIDAERLKSSSSGRTCSCSDARACAELAIAIEITSCRSHPLLPLPFGQPGCRCSVRKYDAKLSGIRPSGLCGFRATAIFLLILSSLAEN